MKLVIIDGNAIVHRAYHALPPMTTKSGKMVNAVYGFTSMLLRVIKDLKPTHLAVTFDVAGGTFRHVKYEKYKATRVKADQELYDQIPLLHDVVSAFNIPIYEKKGYEADDVIGTVAKKTKQNGEVYIVTGDMDTLQLVDKNVFVYTLRKGINDIVIYNEAEVKKRFGFGPELVVDYKALRGDTSDNIPGVPGIGEKTATELILQFGGLKEIYKAVHKEKDKEKSELFSASVLKKMVEGEKSAQMSYELATIDCNVPDLDFKINDCALKEFDREKIVKVFQELEFVSLLKRVPGMTEFEDKKDSKPARGGPALGRDFKFLEIKNEKEIKDILEKITEAGQFGCKAILSAPDVFGANIVGLAVVAGNEGWFIKGEQIKNLLPIFQNEKIELVGHDLKKLCKIFLVYGHVNKFNCHPEPNHCHPELDSGSGKHKSTDKDPDFHQDDKFYIKNKLFDVMVASYLLESGSRAHDSASIILKVLGKEVPKGAAQENLFGVDEKAIAQELFLICSAAEKLRAELKKTDDTGLFEKVEMPLIQILAETENNGVAVDLDLLKKLSKEVTEEIEKLTKKIHKLAGMEFNIASPLQLREVLFEKLDIPVEGIKKGKTGLSTAAEQLEKMRGLHPIIEEIENFRELEKLRNTYIDVLPTLINKKTGRIHTTFNQTVTATGRLSSSDPNLQNIPIRTELGRGVRKAFVAEKGNILVSADYSQIELRIVASLAQDKRMLEIFEKDEDIHKATAAAINGVKLSEVTKEMRRAAKEINFGILYGMGSYGLSWRAEIPQWQAKEFIKKYFEQFSGVKKYIDTTLEFTRRDGYCETLFGRRRYIPELKAQNFQLRSAGERMAINHPVQGTAADLMKMAMIKVHESIKTLKHKNKYDESDVRMILQVHDELVFEVKKGLEKEVGELVKKEMENVATLRVPIKVDVSFNHSWGEMK